ncbi:MAG: tetratricopeptide repeat protein, partial [Burkholderiaceae bacterium]|nr:tetratricopeptide repeat protein [Burkholderiaceae bacterium]
MNTNTHQPRSNIQLLFDAARMRALHEQGRYKESLDISLQITRAYPGVMDGWNGVAANYIRFGRWQEAIRYAHAGLARGENIFGYDTLAFAHGILGQWDETRRYGLLALNMRVRQNNGEPIIPWTGPGVMPPPPSSQTRERNVIVFSLFGGNSKYCEPAVLNVQEQPSIYPNWVCRFYVDASVPESVINRLRAGGAQIIFVEEPAAQWPGPMWRLLALDDPQMHRILFRDADSVISRYEAAAVEQWLASGKRFHMMRDWYSHTELMLAGLWGVVAGSLPPLDKLIQRFMSKPLESRHFADQFFLRQYVWPYARASLMQHDSVFGFMNAALFPSDERPEGFHVGCIESLPVFTLKTDLPDGSEVTWGLFQIQKLDDGQIQEKLICAYPGTVKDGIVKAHIPVRYVRWLKQGT